MARPDLVKKVHLKGWNDCVRPQFHKRWAAILEMKAMKTRGRIVFALLLSGGFAGSAVTASTASAAGSSGNQDAPSTVQTPHMSQKLHNDLAKAGFTDITIMPAAFLVRAKDSQGNPVMMVINPDSVTEVMEHSDAPLSGAIKGEPNSSIPSPPPKPAAKP
jgi:hypothetical protein